MLAEWQNFLTHRGAEIEDGRIVHYGSPEREQAVAITGNIICDLSHYATTVISGNDATAFLHSQFINDVQSLPDDQSQLNGYCNPKGRLIANFRLFKQGDNIILRYPRDVAETFMQKLRMYVLRSKVTIEPDNDALVRVGFSGLTAEQVLGDAIDKIPDNVDDLTREDNLTIIRIPGITPSYELYADVETMKKLWERLDVHAAPVGTQAWQLIEILSGIPHILQTTTEQFIPQMLNYQAIDGLSFNKGCYPGQEIVARMHYLGKLKKRMYLARIKTDESPLPLDELVSARTETGSKTGHIVNAAKHPDGGYAVLAVIQISDAESSEIRLKINNGPVLDIQELPYAVELKSE